MNFLAQTSAISNENVALVGGGSVLLVLLGAAKDLLKTWLLERTKMGAKLKNGSGCKMTPEAIDVIVAKDARGLYRSQFPCEDIKEQHEKQSLTQKEISDTLLKVATTLDMMERRMK